jgi:hypothetical protein
MPSLFIRVFAAGPQQRVLLPVTFDAALAALEQLPQMFAEPDGSFVWVSPPGAQPRWQIDGLLVDGGATLHYVELKGTCPAAELDQLLRCFMVDGTTLSFEAVEQGVVLPLDDVYRAAAPAIV